MTDTLGAGQAIIDNVSVPLANSVFNSDMEGESFTEMRQKVAEILVALDILASSVHDYVYRGEDAKRFADNYNNLKAHTMPKQDVAESTENTGQFIRHFDGEGHVGHKPNACYRDITGFSNGDVEAVVASSGDTYPGLPQGIYYQDTLSKIYDSFLNTDSKAYADYTNTVASGLASITTLSRVTKSGSATDANLSLSFSKASGFNGTLSSNDFGSVSNFLNEKGFRVETDKGDKGYILHAMDRSDKNTENKKSENIETETSDSETETKTATTPAAVSPAVAGGFSGGGGGGGMITPAPRSTPSRGSGSSPRGTKPKLDGEKVSGEEIDIDKMVADMLNENAAKSGSKDIESAVSSLPEGSYTVVNGPDGQPMGYKMSKDFGGGVFLFDSSTGQSTALTSTNQPNIYIDENTGQHYQMNFPDTGEATDSATLSQVESDATATAETKNLSTIDPELLKDRFGMEPYIHEGQIYYVSKDEAGNIMSAYDSEGVPAEIGQENDSPNLMESSVQGPVGQNSATTVPASFTVPTPLSDVMGRS